MRSGLAVALGLALSALLAAAVATQLALLQPPPPAARVVQGELGVGGARVQEEEGPTTGYVFIPPWLYEPLMQWWWLLLLLLHLLPPLLLLLRRRRRGGGVELVIAL